MPPGEMSPAERLEEVLVRDFVRDYLKRALGTGKMARIDTGKLIAAARFSGIKAPARVVMRVLDELVR